MVCTPDFFDAWLTTKAYAKGKTGKERWKKHFSAQKCMLLAARRLYVLMPTPSILFGCLSTVNLSKSSLSKNLGLIDAGAADAPEPVYLDRVPFSAGSMYDKSAIQCTECLSAISSMYRIFQRILKHQRFLVLYR